MKLAGLEPHPVNRHLIGRVHRILLQRLFIEIQPSSHFLAPSDLRALLKELVAICGCPPGTTEKVRKTRINPIVNLFQINALE